MIKIYLRFNNNLGHLAIHNRQFDTEAQLTQCMWKHDSLNYSDFIFYHRIVSTE